MTEPRVNVPRPESRFFDADRSICSHYTGGQAAERERRRKRTAALRGPTDIEICSHENDDLRARRQFRLTKRLTQFSYSRYEISFRDGSRIVPFIAYLDRLRESVITQRESRAYCEHDGLAPRPPAADPPPSLCRRSSSSSSSLISIFFFFFLFFFRRVSARPRLFLISRRHHPSLVVLNDRG